MLEAAAELRYAYYAVTDHAPNLYMQRMTDEKMLAQRAAARARCSHRYPKMRLLHGTELNIDPDGGVDWDEEFLAGFDVTVASVHSHFTQSKEEHDPPRDPGDRASRTVNIIGHLTDAEDRAARPRSSSTSRRCSRRPAAPAPRWRSTRYPDRLDLRDEHILWAKRHGVRFAVDTDAHAIGHLDADALRRRHRAARLAHEGRRDQRVAHDEARSGSCARAGS